MSNMQLVDIRRQEQTSLFPYEGAQRRIDEEITALDRTKMEIERYLADTAGGGTASGKGESKHG